MSRVCVMIETDHTDTDDAVRSVIGAMERAGYNLEDYGVKPVQIVPENWYMALVMDGHVSVFEPETRRYPND